MIHILSNLAGLGGLYPSSSVEGMLGGTVPDGVRSHPELTLSCLLGYSRLSTSIQPTSTPESKRKSQKTKKETKQDLNLELE